jgi:hypothetical protein
MSRKYLLDGSAIGAKWANDLQAANAQIILEGKVLRYQLIDEGSRV